MKQLLVFISLLISICNPAFSQDQSRTIIKNVNVFDGVNEKLQMGTDILIEGKLIKKIGENLSSKGATVINGEGKTLIPGLIDAHWHTYYANAPQSILFTGDISEVAIIGFLGAERTLMRGFTSVRDVGGNPFAVKKMTDKENIQGLVSLPLALLLDKQEGTLTLE